MNEVLVVIPTIIDHRYKYFLIDQLHREPAVKQILLIDNGDCFPGPNPRYTNWNKVWRVRPGCNMNWLHSCNFGAAIALQQRIPYVCFLNDDVWLSRNFFKSLMPAFEHNPDAALLAPSYNGQFDPVAHDDRSTEEWTSTPEDIVVPYVDGTCLVLPLQTLETAGLLDPTFRHPGWGAEIDYAHRVKSTGNKVYVTRRAKVWHQTAMGGTSAVKVYGSRSEWLSRGCRQAREDLETKYGPQWREVLSLPDDSFK